MSRNNTTFHEGRFFYLWVLLPLLLAGCSEQNHKKIADACIKGTAGYANVSRAATLYGCECLATTAQKYLNPDDYALLANVAAELTSNDAPDVKAYQTINTLKKSGVLPSRAVELSIDFGFVLERFKKECGPSRRD